MARHEQVIISHPLACRAQHHLVGVKPDIQLEPTIAGIRAGRDELLEQAPECENGNDSSKDLAKR